MSEQKIDWKAGDEITSASLNLIGNGINASTELANTAVNTANEAKSIAENAVTQSAQSAQIASDAAISANDALTKAQTALADLEINSTADAQIKALAEANKALIEANADADAALAGRVTTLEGDYVSKAELTDGFTAQSKYNLVTYNYSKDDGSYSQIWNEASGGGSRVYDKTSDIIAYLGSNVGRGDKDIWGQFYAKVKATNVGTRVNFTNHGVYMTVDKANSDYTEDDLLLTKKDIANVLTSDRIGGWVTVDGVLKNEQVKKVYDNGNENLWFCESDGSAFYTTDTKTKVRKCWATDARTNTNRSPADVKNTDIDVISYCRVTEANSSIGFSANQGARLIGNVFGYYYTKNKTKSSDFDPVKDEIATVGIVQELLASKDETIAQLQAQVSALLERVQTLENNQGKLQS